MSKIELYPHNEEAFQSIVNSLENSNFSFIERATGTGKSYILIKYLAEKMRGKRVLFVTTHEPMFQQFVNQDMPALGVSKDSFAKLDLVIYSNINRKQSEWYYKNYDCVIFDEAHHCGAPVWSKTIGELRDLIRLSSDKVMIGATATSIRYLDEYTDVAKEYFDNNVASRLSLSKAILEEILPAPIYINICRGLDDELRKVRKKLKSIGPLEELNHIYKKIDAIEKSVDKEKNVNDLLKQNGVKNGDKYIVFCSSKEDLERKIEESKYWFDGVGNLDIYSVHSGQSKAKNQSQIDDFSINDPNSIKVMFAIDIFNEGMHIPGVDGVIMARKTSSPIVYLQQLGRALSFSARKKQIKVFDLVGNASNIDVIHDLYKELLLTAEEELQTNPEKRELYSQVIDRFKIVKKGNELLEAVSEINNYLNENYIIKNVLERNISGLEQYVKYICRNFMDDLNSGRIDKPHKNMYKILCKNSSNLSVDQLFRLSKIGIIVSSWQEDKNVLEQIEANGTYANYVEKNTRDVFDRYNLFYLKNRRRPTIDDDKELVTQYRKYLVTIRRSKVKRYLADVEYKYNVEELLLLNGYPDRSDLDAYLDFIENKYYNGITLDTLEIRTLSRIKFIMNLDDRQELKELLSSRVLKIDDAIKKISKFVDKTLVNSKVIPYSLISSDSVVSAAYTYILKNYKYLTNSQFQALVDLKIELVGVLNTSLEERYNLLKGYDSLFEYEKIVNRTDTNELIKFINEFGRRPDSRIETERKLAAKYNRLLQQDKSIYFDKIGEVFAEKNIELTFSEKIVLGRKISQEEAKRLYFDVINNLKNPTKSSFIYSVEKKKIYCLLGFGIIDHRLFRTFIRSIKFINFVYNEINFNEMSLDIIKNRVWDNKDVLSMSLIETLSEMEVLLPASLISQIVNLDKATANIAHFNYDSYMKPYHEYMDYIKNKGRRPTDDYLVISMRQYLIDAHVSDKKKCISQLNSLGVSILPEELFVSGNMSAVGEETLYKQLRKRVNSGESLNILERYVLDIIRVRRLFKETGNKMLEVESSLKPIKQEATKTLIEDIKMKIVIDPYCFLDFNGDLSIIPEKEQRELREFQIDNTIEDFVEKNIKKMRAYNLPLMMVLSAQDKIYYDDVVEFNKKNKKYAAYLKKLSELNKEIVLNLRVINQNATMEEYFEFININGKIPSVISDNIEERIVAEKMDLILSLSSVEEQKEILLQGKNILDSIINKNFYDQFVSFIQTNERFPSVLSDDEVEVRLANMYSKDGSKFNKDQKKEILLLQKKYQMNTIKYFNSKKGK